MIAARLHLGDSQLRLDEVAEPDAVEDHCLIEVVACGICGSDLHVLGGEIPVPRRPLTLGHEAAGVVRAIGENVREVAVGDRVFVDPMLVCRRCIACRSGRSNLCSSREIIGIHVDGALAELVAVPSDNVVVLPPHVDLLEAAMIESAATPFHALTARAPSVAGEAVAVVGVGGLGFHAVAIARLLGAAEVIAIDVRPAALERAFEHGATRGYLATDGGVARAVRQATGGGVAVALECVGRMETCALATSLVRSGGVCVIQGVGGEALVGPRIETLTAREIELRGAFAYTRSEIDRIVALVGSARLDLRSAVSETYPLPKVQDAIASLRSRDTNPVRVVVTPNTS